MDDYDRRTAEIFARAERRKKQKRKRVGIAAASIGMCFLLTCGLVLFLPYPNGGLPDVGRYAGSEYYDLIKELNPLTRSQKIYKNNFERWFSGVTGELNGSDSSPTGPTGDVSFPDSAGGQKYEETTKNQVDGVKEGDLFKRSDEYIYYLTSRESQRESRGNIVDYEYTLKIYSIAGEDSAEISSFTIAAEDNFVFYQSYVGRTEMYLSEDCRTVSVVTDACDTETNKIYTAIVPLDVGDVGAIRRNDTVYVSGSCISTRSVDGEVILMSNFTVPSNPDFDDETQYVPRSGTAGAMTPFSADEIVIPAGSTAARYTVVSLFDGAAITSRLAFLSYSTEAYVNTADIYLTQNYFRKIGNDRRERMTRIARIAYAGGELDFKGKVEIAGTVLNQYSMDVRENVLRVVTTTRTSKIADPDKIYLDDSIDVCTSASLYCIDIRTFEVIAGLENFAPIGEEVKSARFEADTAYVCTAIEVILRDPVFVIDLRDLNNITYKHTGEIDGYSFSLTEFADGTLLGIGYDANRKLKIELFIETDTSVESLTAYVLDTGSYASFSEIYKAHLIDSENRLIGLCVLHDDYIDHRYEQWHEYLLVTFDGENLIEIGSYKVEASSCNTARATVIDGYVYILTDGGITIVKL